MTKIERWAISKRCRCLECKGIRMHHAIAGNSRIDIVYAECQGPTDPICGLARFSLHGCNGGPSRVEYLTHLRLQADA